MTSPPPPDAPEVRRLVAGSARLVVEERGAGPPLVFLHGAVQTARVWDRQVIAFAPDWRTVAYDLRGHGRSTLGDEPLTVDTLADDLFRVMDGLAIDSAALVGVSLGGMVALHAVARDRSRVRAVALANTPLALSTSPTVLATLDWLNPYALLRPAFALLGPKRTAEFGLALARRVMGADFVSEDTARFFVAGFATMRRGALIATYRAISEAGLPALDHADLPALIVLGEHEVGLVIRHARLIAAQLGAAEIVTVGGGHVTNLDAPDAFNDVLHAFLLKTR